MGNSQLKNLILKFTIWLPCLLHFVVAWMYRLTGQVSILADPARNTWNWFWQTAPMELLIDRPLETVWYFHAQPPLFNVVGAILGIIFYPYHLEALYTLNIFLGTLIVIMLTYIVYWETDNKFFALLIGCFFAFFPAIFVYEAYILYTIHIVFFITLYVFWMALYKRTRQDKFLFFAFGTLITLVLYRSFFHPIVLLFTLPLLLFYAHERIKALGVFAVLLTPVIIILLKNYLLFGFIGTSSWSGMNLYKIAIARYSPEALTQLVDDNILDAMVVDVSPFRIPSQYRDYGFEDESSIPILSLDNRNNINYPAISDVYFENALALIMHNPSHYLETIVNGYGIYVKPSARFKHTNINARAINLHELIYSKPLHYTTIDIKGYRISVMMILIPFPLLVCSLYLFVRCNWKLSCWVGQIRSNPLEVTLFLFIAYGLIVGNMLEYSENDRFKFLTELHIIVFSAILVWRIALAMFSKKVSPRQLDK
jgi:hypothetical protein